MGLLKKIFIGLVSMLLIIDLCLLVFINTMNETLFNPDFIEMELDRLGFYSALREKIIENVEDKRFTDVVNRSIPEGWIKEKVQLLLKNVFGYIKSDTDTIDMTVSLIEIKDNIVIEGTPIFGDALMDVVYEELPDELDVYDFLKLGEIGILEQLRMFFGYFKIFLYLLVFIAIILILLIILSLRELKSIFLVISISSLLSGGISYGIYILSVDLISAQIRGLELEFLPTDFLLIILEDVLFPVKNYGVLLLIAGGLLLIAYLILRILEEGRETKGEEETEQLLRGEIKGD